MQPVPVESIKSEQVDATPRFYFHLNRTTPAADISSLFLFDGANLWVEPGHRALMRKQVAARPVH